jgi:hypothetical protein
VAITTGLGKLAVDSDPSWLAAVFGGIAFGITMLALLVALGIAIIKVLIPQESSAISIKRIESYPTWTYLAEQPRRVPRARIQFGSLLATEATLPHGSRAWLLDGQGRRPATASLDTLMAYLLQRREMFGGTSRFRVEHPRSKFQGLDRSGRRDGVGARYPPARGSSSRFR